MTFQNCRCNTRRWQILPFFVYLKDDSSAASLLIHHAQHITAQHINAQHSTAPHSTAQHSTADPSSIITTCLPCVRTVFMNFATEIKGQKLISCHSGPSSLPVPHMLQGLKRKETLVLSVTHLTHSGNREKLAFLSVLKGVNCTRKAQGVVVFANICF